MSAWVCERCWEPSPPETVPCPECGYPGRVSVKYLAAVDLVARWEERDARILRLAQKMSGDPGTQRT